MAAASRALNAWRVPSFRQTPPTGARGTVGGWGASASWHHGLFPMLPAGGALARAPVLQPHGAARLTQEHLKVGVLRRALALVYREELQGDVHGLCSGRRVRAPVNDGEAASPQQALDRHRRGVQQLLLLLRHRRSAPVAPWRPPWRTRALTRGQGRKNSRMTPRHGTGAAQRCGDHLAETPAKGDQVPCAAAPSQLLSASRRCKPALPVANNLAKVRGPTGQREGWLV